MAELSLSIKYLDDLSKEWMDSKTSLAVREDPLSPDHAVPNSVRIQADTSTVHKALISQVPKTISSTAVPIHLTARDIEAVLAAATENAGRVRKVERTRYLYWLL